MINSSIILPGRLCNHFFRNIFFDFISRKYNIKFEYGYYEELKKLGIFLYIDGTNKFNDSFLINDDNFMDYVNNKLILDKNFYLPDGYGFYAQTRDFVFFMKDYFNTHFNQNILNSNYFKDRYNNNNDVFVHLRIGDVPHFTPSFSYYDKCLSNINFENGYISSDTIEDDLCKKLIDKYNLKIIDKDEVETIMFGSTCKSIVLSNGTFSWLIGFLGFYSNIFYPKIKNIWHGDIFVFEEWNEVDY